MAAVAPNLDATVLVEAMLHPWNWRVALNSQFNEIYGTIAAALGRVVAGEQALATAMEAIRPQIEAALAVE